MLRNFDEIFEFVDPECKIYPWFEREANQIGKELEGFFEYLRGFCSNDFKKCSLPSADPVPVWLKAETDDYCDICLVSLEKEILKEAKGKKGHVKCLNFWLNRIIKED